MDMTPQKAIQILERQRDKVDDASIPNDEVLVFQTAEYIKTFFGETSEQYNFISRYSFWVKYTSMDDMVDVRRWMKERPLQFKRFLNDCIEFINDNGLYKLPKKNFLANINNGVLIPLVLFILPIIFFSGKMVGENVKNKEELKIEKNYQDLRDSVTLAFPKI